MNSGSGDSPTPATGTPRRQGNVDFAVDVFTDRVMRERLPKEVFRSYKRSISLEERLDPNVAHSIASAMKDWAIERGATHYSRSTTVSSRQMARVTPSPSSAEASSSKASPMRRASRPAACAPRSKLADTPLGIPQARHSSAASAMA
jgi:hypothetical protein